MRVVRRSNTPMVRSAILIMAKFSPFDPPRRDGERRLVLCRCRDGGLNRVPAPEGGTLFFGKSCRKVPKRKDTRKSHLYPERIALAGIDRRAIHSPLSMHGLLAVPLRAVSRQKLRCSGATDGVVPPGLIVWFKPYRLVQTVIMRMAEEAVSSHKYVNLRATKWPV